MNVTIMHLYNSSVLDIVTSNKMQLPKFLVWKARGHISLVFIIEIDISPCLYGDIIPILFRDARFEYRPEHRPSLQRVVFVFFSLSRINLKVPMTLLSHYWTQCATNFVTFSSYRYPLSRQPSPVTIMIDQKQLENVECFKYLGSLLTNDGRCTRDIKSRIAMAKARRRLFLPAHWT